MKVRLLAAADLPLLEKFCADSDVDQARVAWLIRGLQAKTPDFVISAIVDEEILSIIVGCTFSYILKVDKVYPSWFIPWTRTRPGVVCDQHHRNMMSDNLVHYFERLGFSAFFFTVRLPKSNRAAETIARQNHIDGYEINIRRIVHQGDRAESVLEEILLHNISNFPVVICKMEKK